MSQRLSEWLAAKLLYLTVKHDVSSRTISYLPNSVKSLVGQQRSVQRNLSPQDKKMSRPKKWEEFFGNNENKEVSYMIAFENVKYRLVCCMSARSQSSLHRYVKYKPTCWHLNMVCMHTRQLYSYWWTSVITKIAGYMRNCVYCKYDETCYWVRSPDTDVFVTFVHHAAAFNYLTVQLDSDIDCSVCIVTFQ